MAGSLDYLEGKKVCIVFVHVLDQVAGRVKLQPSRVASGGTFFLRPTGRARTIPP